MASFDLITAAGNAYIKIWTEREYLFRMAMIPLFIKYIFYSISVLYFGADNIIRLSLVMLPAYFAEGWLLSHWARTIILNHRWPFRPSGDEKKDYIEIQKRARGILGGMVTYVLINLLMAGYFSFFMSYLPADMNPEQADPKVALMGVVMMVSLLLLFRFIWLYIPLAVNAPMVKVFENLKPMLTSFSMMGLWLVCFIPAAIVLQFINGGLQTIAGENPIAVMEGLILFVRVFIDMIKNLICTAGIAYAFIAIMGWKQKT